MKQSLRLWFLQRFEEYRNAQELLDVMIDTVGEVSDKKGVLEKKAESDAALIESLYRYIAALEGKAAYQAELLQELREKDQKALDTIRELKGHLSGILPPKEDL